jgi:virulence factor
MRVAVIGLGDIAQKAYLPIIAMRSDIELVFCTRNPQALAAMSAKYRVANAVSSIDQLLSLQPAPVAAFVHTSTESHPAIVSALLNRGIHVYVDKPLAYHLEEAERMTFLARKCGAVLMTGFNRRFAPMYAALREAEGREAVIMQKNRLPLPGEARRFVFDDFIRVVDTLRYLAPDGAMEMSMSSVRKGDLVTQVALQLQGPKGIAIGLMNRDSGATEERLEVMCPGQKWVVEGMSNTVHYLDGEAKHSGFGDWDPILFRRGFVQIIDHFLACVAHGNSPSISSEDALETHALCERILAGIEGRIGK